MPLGLFNFSPFVRVNLALAYTELTEELCRLRNLSSLQSQILRTLMQEQAINGGEQGMGGVSQDWIWSCLEEDGALAVKHFS